MQSRLSVMDEKKGDFDPLEFDRYTGAGIRGLAEVSAQEKLVKRA
jgi:hypothetical protein